MKNTPLSNKPTIFYVILITLLGFAIYANSLSNDFIWDDGALIEENRYVKSWSYLPQIFTQDIRSGYKERQLSFYRPLQMVTYMADYSIWKLNPIGYHLTNTLLHIAVALGILWLVSLLFNNSLMACITAAFYVAHPVHTEAVTYISGRADSLALLFMLICFIFYIKSSMSKSPSVYFLMILSYVLALLSRENSLILPVLLLIYHTSFHRKIKVKEFFSVTGIASTYIILRVTVLKGMAAPLEHATTLFERLPGFFVALTTYVRLLFLPFDLHMEYGGVLYLWTDPKAILGMILLSALLTYALTKGKESRVTFFAIIWFLVALLPVSNIFPINAYMAEHWLYVPSIGFFLVLANMILALHSKEKFKIAATVVGVALLIFYSLLTVRQNTYWRNPINFYKRTLEYAPESARVHNALGYSFHAADNNEEAIASYKRAIKIDPYYAGAHYNLGNAYSVTGKNEEAIAAYEKAINVKPDYPKAFYNLGFVYSTIGKNEEAIKSYKKALEFKDDYAQAHHNLGTVYYAVNKNKEAILSYKRAIGIKPDYADAHYNLGNAYDNINDVEEAISSYKRAIEINPQYAMAYNNLAAIYFQREQYQLAIKYCDRAVASGLTNTAFLKVLEPYRGRK